MTMLDDNALAFSYAGWTPDTQLTMTNVPWNNDYRDIVKFANKTALDTWINASNKYPTEIVGSYARLNVPIRLNVPFEVAQGFNYIRARNGVQPIPGSTMPQSFYYFILDVRYLAPNTTELVIQLDVWQSFGYSVTFGQCYVERGHIGMANTKSFQNYGRDYLAIPEGLEIGGEYQTVAVKKQEIMWNVGSYAEGSGSYRGSNYNILVVSTVDLGASPGTVDAPRIVSAPGSNFEGLPSGASMYVWASVFDFTQFMKTYADKPWVTQGIISITAIPAITRYFPFFGFNNTNNGINGGTLLDGAHNANEAPQFTRFFDSFPDWRNSTELLNKIPARWRNLKKLFTFPYMAIELTTWGAKGIVLKPESWNQPNGRITERANLTPPAQRVAFIPRDYNTTTPGLPLKDDDGGDYLDLMTMITNFPTFAIVNNAAIAYMASNANSIAFQNSSASWSQQRALQGNSVSYDQAGVAMNAATKQVEQAISTSGAQVALQNSQMWRSVGTNALGGVAGGAGMGLVAGPAGAAVGAASGAVSGAMGIANAAISEQGNNAGLVIGSQQSRAANRINNETGAYMRDSNKGLADWGAKGDYSNAIAGINARTQDAQLIQPTQAGQVGGETFNLVHSNVEISARWKMIDYSAMAVVCEYWLRYGYAVRRFIQLPDLHVMSKFSYWKLSETYLKSAPMPESYKQVIRGIFEKGVTVWKSPNDIGFIDIADNVPTPGVSF